MSDERQRQARAPIEEKWGDAITKERQQELQGYLDRWAAETDQATGKDHLTARRREALSG
jgi:hypothetical protein